jgi:general secretion pathway protein M
MNFPKFLEPGKAAPPYVAALAYAGLMLMLVFVITTSWTGIQSRRTAIDALNDMMMRLEGRSPSATREGTADGAVSGSYFLEGPTVTVAGAALLQRVVGAVNQHGGNVLSSQVDLQGTRSKDGFLTVTASCVIEQPALQRLIYDLEAGMPFLFIEQLEVQAPSASTGATGGKLRVLLSVSGQWQGAK